MKIVLIKNTESQSHFDHISELIDSSEVIYIAIAFLKKSGLDQILPNIKKGLSKGKIFQIIAGQHFATTEPAALWALYHLFNQSNSELKLAKLKSSEVFHPKIYLFQKGSEINITTGSANFTNGGFINNFELSLSYNGGDTDTIWKDCKNYFEDLFKNNSLRATRLEILRYEKFYNEQKPFRDKIKSVPKRSKIEIEFSYDKLKKHFKKYNKAKREQRFTERVNAYKHAKQILEIIATSKSISKLAFSKLLDELVGGSDEHRRYWHSGGLSRGKMGKKGQPGINDNWKHFIQLVRFIRTNKGKKASYLFENGKLLLNKIPGAGINILTEIMMTYNTDSFAIMNNNPLKVLRTEAGCGIKATPNSYTGVDYEEYCELINEINHELGLRNMLEADSFFNDVYWPLKTKGIIK